MPGRRGSRPGTASAPQLCVPRAPSGRLGTMIDALLVVLHVAALVAIAAALIRPRWRRPVAVGLLALGVLAVPAALLGPKTRSLELRYAFARFEGAELGLGEYIVDTTTAAGWLWGVVALGFAAVWAAYLWRAAPRPDGAPRAVHAFLAPLGLAWSGLALMLLFEQVAAPAGLVAPYGVERPLLPAGIAAAVLLATRVRRVFATLAWLAIFLSVSRAPVAVLGTWATLEGLGTSLDVHTITRFANPLAAKLIHVEP